MSDQTTDLVAFLREQLIADIAAQAEWATASHTGQCGYDMGMWANACDCGGPARVLAEIASKQRILVACVMADDDLAVHPHPDIVEPWAESLLDVLYALAAPYRGRTGWNEDWSSPHPKEGA